MIKVEKLNLDGEVMSFSDIWKEYDPDCFESKDEFSLLDLIIHEMEHIKLPNSNNGKI